MDELFLTAVKLANLPSPISEYEFTALRKYRLDYAWPEYRIAAELNGGIYRKGGHSSISGLQRDYEKLNHAQAIGWIVFQFSHNMLKDTDYVVSVLRRGMEERESNEDNC